MKIDISPPIILFYRDEGLYWGFVGDALRACTCELGDN
jgi:hypothetical protein